MSAPSEEAAVEIPESVHSKVSVEPKTSFEIMCSKCLDTPDILKLVTGTTPSLISHILAKPYMQDLAATDRTRFAEICLIAAGSRRSIVDAKLAGYPALRETLINDGKCDWTSDSFHAADQLNLTALGLVGHMIARAAPNSSANPAVKQLRTKIGGKDIWTMKNALEMQQGNSKPCQIWVERIKKNPVAEVDEYLQAVIDYFAPAGLMASSPSH